MTTPNTTLTKRMQTGSDLPPGRQRGVYIRQSMRRCKTHGIEYKVEEIFGNGSLIHVNGQCPACDAIFKSSPEYKAEIAAKEQAEREAREEQEREERERRDAAEKARMDARIARSRVPRIYQGLTLKDVRPIDPSVKAAIEKARMYVDNFDEWGRQDGMGLVLFGLFGTGKTLMACAIINELLPTVQGRYITMWDLLRLVKLSESYGADRREVEDVIESDLLVIDEVGVQNGNSFEESQLMQVVDRRVSNGKPTIYITNLMPEPRKDPHGKRLNDQATMIEKLGARLFNRISGTTWFVLFKGQSQRKPLPPMEEYARSRRK